MILRPIGALFVAVGDRCICTLLSYVANQQERAEIEGDLAIWDQQARRYHQSQLQRLSDQPRWRLPAAEYPPGLLAAEEGGEPLDGHRGTSPVDKVKGPIIE